VAEKTAYKYELCEMGAEVQTKLDILTANNHLEITGGTENYTYALIDELLRCGHRVEYFTFHKGKISEKIEELGVKFMSKEKYDIIFASHNKTVEKLFEYGFIVQTTHGILPGLEEPSCFSDFNVAVSMETHKYLNERGFENIIINNGINCDRFFPKIEIKQKPANVLSLCQSEAANVFIEKCCKRLKIKFRKIDKCKDNKWEVEEEINNADLVIGIGRSLYDAMACGRAVISYDKRYGQKKYEGDGYLDAENIEESLKWNCSGRGASRLFNENEFIEELKKYRLRDGLFMREFAQKRLNIRNSAEQYLAIYNNYKANEETYKLIKTHKMKFRQEMERTINNFEKEIKASKAWRMIETLKKIKRFILK
jgi:glycosyltransferase involved in cell wall biosynthesis